MRKAAILLALAAACSNPSADLEAGSNEMLVMGAMPEDARIAAARILRDCGVPTQGVRIFDDWEGSIAEGRWIILLTPDQSDRPRVVECLEDKTQQARANHSIGWRISDQEPPPPEPTDG